MGNGPTDPLGRLVDPGHTPNDTAPETMEGEMIPSQPDPFSTWAALAAAAEAGDEKAREFLLTYWPWAEALRKRQASH
jgi:hypothetical protein